ncbi:MAG: DUF1476 domain-containing protein [Alphaproteobacteria bacterium]|nr:DUF1476 domain-containing protein [Alphaproteobacteria bacterium]MBU0859997.1 DUF1476 domain-containing protein [Alphaproteobacteria bacterium]
MSGFDDRKGAFEKKFAMDEELIFKAEARCCKLFGLWVAEQMGLTGGDADAYARSVVAANLEEVGFDDVKRKVMPDIAAKGLDISEHTIDTKLAACFEEAKHQIVSENT